MPQGRAKSDLNIHRNFLLKSPKHRCKPIFYFNEWADTAWINSPLPVPNPAETNSVLSVCQEGRIHFQWTEPKANSGKDPLGK